MKFEPVIKWSGSKRLLSEEIIKYTPSEIDTYYEPFCGSCSVGFQLMLNNRKIKKYIFSDINKELISFMNILKKDYTLLYNEYKERYDNLYSCKTIEDKKKYYNEIRKRYNVSKNVHDFIFLSRTCANGLIRYNKKGEFNSPFHLTRNGITPQRYLKILKEWNNILNKNNVEFIEQSYKNINPNERDYVFLDPPYVNTKGMYFGGIDIEEYFKFLNNLKCSYSFTFDGKTDSKDRTYEVPYDCYNNHIYLNSIISGFMKLHKESEYVKESLYIKNK